MQVDAGQICPPHSKGQKNDFNDAEAIAEAVQRPTMKFVATKAAEQLMRTELPTILATRADALSPRMLRVIEELAGDWRRLDPRIDGLSGEIEALAPSRSGMFAPDDSTWHRADHFERHGGRDRHWRRILQRPRLRRLARTGAQADLDGRPHDP